MRLLLSFFLFTTWMFADAHILIYHRFGDDRYPSTNISLQNLREQFKYFNENGYEIVPLKKLIQKVKNSEYIPDNWLVLTIDDGYKSFYKNGFPIFKEFGYPFTLFVYVEASQKKYGDYMSFDDIKDVQNWGAEIGYHSYSHKYMTYLNESEIKDDFEKGIQIFEHNLGYKPQYFSYPYGEYNQTITNMAKEYGLEASFNQNSGAVSASSSIGDLDRIPSMDGTNLKAMLSSRYLKADFIQPLTYPSNSILDNVIAKIDSNSTSAQLYISGLGSMRVDVSDGIIDVNISKKLIKRRVRVIINDGHKTTTQMIIKDKNVR